MTDKNKLIEQLREKIRKLEEEKDKILEEKKRIEKERNELAYGKPVSEIMLRHQINSFFKLKELIENV